MNGRKQSQVGSANYVRKGMASLTCRMFFLWLHTPETLVIPCGCFQDVDPLSSFTYSAISLDLLHMSSRLTSVSKGINDLYMINELGLINIYRLWHLMQFQNILFRYIPNINKIRSYFWPLRKSPQSQIKTNQKTEKKWGSTLTTNLENKSKKKNKKSSCMFGS